MWLCHTLSPFYASTPPSPPAFLWPEIIRRADAWLVGPRLYLQISSQGILPDEAADLLATVTDLAKARAALMRADLEEMIVALNDAGLEPVVIKGAEWLLGHYAPNALRPIADLDIWFPTLAEQNAAIEVFQANGYRSSQTLQFFDRTNSHHFPPFLRDEDSPRFELHHKLIRSTLTDAMDTNRAASRLISEVRGGLRYRRLALIDGVTVAFFQSGRMSVPNFDTRRVPFAKWLDFLDRFQAAQLSAVNHPSDIGVADGDNPTDRQLLTALALACHFPYNGPLDPAYLDGWNTEVTLAKSLKMAFEWHKVFSPKAWIRFVRQFPERLKAIRFLNSL